MNRQVFSNKRWCFLAVYFVTLPATLSGQESSNSAKSDVLVNFELVFNSSERKTKAEFVRSNLLDPSSAKIERIVALLERLRDEWGPIKVIESYHVDDRSRRVASHLIVKTMKSNQWKAFQFFCSDEQTDRYHSFAIVDAIEPKKVPNGSIEEPDVQAWLDKHIRWLEETRQLSGAFAVSKNGKTVYRQNCGWANFDRQLPISNSTVFNLASGTKMFTAICIAKLVENGRLKFDDRLIDILPNYENRKVGERVTVRHLLTHTSGLVEFWTQEFEKSWDKIDGPADVKPFFINQDLQFEPGKQHQYCNTNYIVLGLIVESLTGNKFGEFMNESVFVPADMTNSGFRQDKVYEKSKVFAQPYEVVLVENKDQKWIPSKLGKNGSPAGGSYSSVDDLLRFDRALNSFRLLSPKMTNLVTQGKVKQQVGGMYGFGFMESEIKNVRRFGHGGTAPGVFFDYKHFPESGYAIVYMCNHNGTAAMDVFRKITAIVTRKTNEPKD